LKSSGSAFSIPARQPGAIRFETLPFRQILAAALFSVQRFFEPLHRRRITHCHQQRFETVRVIAQGDRLDLHCPSDRIGGRRKSAFDVAGARQPGAFAKLAPACEVSRGEVFVQGPFQNLDQFFLAKQPEAGVVAGEQNPVATHPQQAGRLLVKKVAQM
jgi:hypothetical protein